MKKFLAGALGGAAVFAVIFGAGPAGADDEYVGNTYAKAQERSGGRVVIASRTGSYLPTEECIVTSNRTASFADSSGNRNAKILADLNCNDPMSAGHPGYSAASEQGKKAASLKQFAKNISKDYASKLEKGETPYCGETDRRIEVCQNACRDSRSCSPELLEYLGL